MTETWTLAIMANISYYGLYLNIDNFLASIGFYDQDLAISDFGQDWLLRPEGANYVLEISYMGQYASLGFFFLGGGVKYLIGICGKNQNQTAVSVSKCTTSGSGTYR